MRMEKQFLVKKNIFRYIKRYLFIFIIKLMKNKLNEEEASINQSLYYPKNLIFELKKIYPEKMNYINNNYFKDHNIDKTDLNEFKGFNLFSDISTKGENQGQIESFESFSKSLARLYFINKKKRIFK